MAKRYFIIILGLLYLNVSVGIGVQFHYCMGELVSMALGHHADHENDCGDCGMDIRENTCCKDESLLIKVDDGHHPSSYSFNFEKYALQTAAHLSPLISASVLNSSSVYQEHSTPFFSYRPGKRYLSIRVLRI